MPHCQISQAEHIHTYIFPLERYVSPKTADSEKSEGRLLFVNLKKRVHSCVSNLTLL